MNHGPVPQHNYPLEYRYNHDMNEDSYSSDNGDNDNDDSESI